MEDTHAGGTAGILEDALALAGAGRLDNAARARLWALVAEGVIAGGTAHALVEIDVQARGRAGKAGKDGSAAAKAAKREEIRLAWANSVPWSIRGRIDLPLATWAVLGMMIARAGCTRDEWRAELSLTEMQRRLGGAGRKTVAGAVARLERAGFVRAIRRRRNPRFSEVNVYILEQPEAARAAARAGWLAEEAVQAPVTGERAGASLGGPRAAQEAPSRAPEGRQTAPAEGLRANPGVPGGVSVNPGSSPVSNSSPKETHKNLIEDSTTKLQINRPARTNLPIPPSPSKPRTTNLPSCSSLQDRKSRTYGPLRPTQAPEQRVEPLPETAASSLTQEAAAELGECGNGDHWQMAETLLKSQMTGFHRTAWAAARARHGPRAALAVIETALIVRLRAGTEDPIRSAPAYLGGILRRKPQDCRPEITLQRLAAARAAAKRPRAAALQARRGRETRGVDG